MAIFFHQQRLPNRYKTLRLAKNVVKRNKAALTRG